ncbi:glycosyltransferase family A protein [Leptolyngbya sp. CCNP1308]|uniref:glycosyltransferase family 2 protein n=1 Tax=Leptolyngbya sp. CCNP1308 TaxID=3110255 RepID=UPI002B1EFBFA|nr:glycosyltransferase family A protein [Leptolyngbya sp. CCNP1308]MEA5448604.1 glycosyltransferase family A protein [Leptolyngbya sp. CCNP1308]
MYYQILETAFIPEKPLVSVIIPAYNAEKFIAQTLFSVLNQTYHSIEILVIDDGSSDRTPEIVKTLAQQYSQIQLLRQANAGVAAARNLGIQAARGEFIAPIDSDDLWHPDTIAKLLNQFDRSCSKVGVVYAWSVDIDEQGQFTGGFHAAVVVGDVYKTLICHNFLGNASSTLIRKCCLEQVGGYNPLLKAQQAQGCEDWDLYLRLAAQYSFAVVPEFLVGYRKQTTSMSGDYHQMARSQQLMLKTAQQNHPEIPGFLYRLSRSSFYLYLAHQCHSQGQAANTLLWLWQALKIDPITPLGRPGFYQLLVINLLRLGLGYNYLPTREVANLSDKKASISGLPYSAVSITASPVVLRASHPKVWVKVWVNGILHRTLQFI